MVKGLAAEKCLPDSTQVKTSHLLDREQLCERARSIGEQLLEKARTMPLGGYTWTGPRGYGTDLNPLEIVQLRPHLYDGVMGIAIFFAALAKVTQNREAATICQRIIEPVRRWLSRHLTGNSRRPSIAQIGGLIGIGSILYSFQRISELLDDPRLSSDAERLVELFTTERINNDHQGRIQTGCAGAILSLLALPPSAREGALARARACAERLLDLRISLNGRPAAWPLSPGKPPLVGFSYGAAGVAHALRRLAVELDDQRYLQAAEEGDLFVASHYDPELADYLDARALFQKDFEPSRGTWRDWWANGTLEDLERRPASEARSLSKADLLPAMWCHGSPGIVAAKLAALAWNDGPKIRQEIDAGLKVTAASQRAEAADLCCGEAGRIDVLLFASRQLKDPQLAMTALEKLTLLAEKADREGGFQLSAARGRNVFAPSLFQGIAGIGYVLLRAASPDLPCLLVLE